MMLWIASFDIFLHGHMDIGSSFLVWVVRRSSDRKEMDLSGKRRYLFLYRLIAIYIPERGLS